MTELSIQYRRVDSLKEYGENSRIHSDEQVNQVADSIREFGFTNPILIDADGVLIAGHGRLMAARKIGMTEVPCIELGHLTESQRRAYVIADNKLAEGSEWDIEMLAREVALLCDSGYEVSILGFDDTDLAGLIFDEVGDGLTDKDSVPPLPDEAAIVTQNGDVWQMGRHRLICGDSTDPEDVAKALAGELADMVWTDPPYNIDYQGANGKKIKNDNMENDAFFQFLLNAFNAVSVNLKPGGPIYIAHGDGESNNFRSAMTESGLLLKQCLIWVKNQFTLGRQDYQWQHEPILYGWKPGAAHVWHGAFNKSTILDDEVDISSMAFGELKQFVSEIKDKVQLSTIRENKPARNGEHPTMKPVGLIMKMIKNSSGLYDTVLDIFGGSGSTLIAAEQLKRNAALVELDPAYCDVIITRWQDYTGKLAILEEDGRTFDEVATIRDAA